MHCYIGDIQATWFCAKRSETVDEGKVISKMTRSRERMRDGYFSNISALVLFVFRQMLQHREIPFSRRPSFAFRFCFSFVPFNATSTFSQVTLYSVPTFNGRWIFHRAPVSSDCLGGCAKGLKDPCQTLVFFYLYGYLLRLPRNAILFVHFNIT